MVKRIKIFSLLVVISFGLSGCGGGGGGSAGTDTPTAITQTGTFIDAPVEGLEYSTPTLSGFTNGNGEFQYKTGETVTFKIGNLELGSATGGATITPLTLAGDTDLNNIGTKATNIARILQTLDNNSSNGAKLVIPSSLRDLNISGTNLESDSVLNEILTKAQVKTSVAYTLKDATLARNEMKNYINLYQKYNYLTVGTTSLTNEYYLFKMPQDGNVMFSVSGTQGYLYDTNLNAILTTGSGDNFIAFTRGSTPASLSLSAGTYVIKFTGVSQGDTVTINSNVLFNQNNLQELTVGTTSLTNEYYLFKMPQDGNVMFSVSGTQGYLYDTNLNAILTTGSGDNFIAFTRGSTPASLSLSAGTYVIKFIGVSQGDTVTINSNIL
jgi:hypothetical protein